MKLFTATSLFKAPGLAFAAVGLAAAGLAADVPTHASHASNPTARNSARGSYVEARTADVYTGACFAMSEVGLTGDLAVMGWRIDSGSFDGVDLSGLSVVGIVKASATLGDPMASPYPATAVIIVDQKATPEQQIQLKKFAQRMGGDLLTSVVRTEVSPITFDVSNNNIHTRAVSMKAGSLAKIETRPLEEGDKVCRHEEVWYQPLTSLNHAMAAYTTEHAYAGKGLATQWSYPGKRGSFVGTFQLND